MAEIHELIDRVAEPELKAELLAAVDKLSNLFLLGSAPVGHPTLRYFNAQVGKDCSAQSSVSLRIYGAKALVAKLQHSGYEGVSFLAQQSMRSVLIGFEYPCRTLRIFYLKFYTAIRSGE